MIDWIKSAELNNCAVDELEVRFDKYPKSNKYIIRICDKCKDSRKVKFNGYSDFCHDCATTTIEFREMVSKDRIEYNKDPEVRRKNSENGIKQYSTQEARDIQAKRIRNSVAAKIAVENQSGGLDLIWHHIAYDFGRPKALRIRITRKFHGQIHSPKGLGVHQRGYSLID